MGYLEYTHVPGYRAGFEDEVLATAAGAERISAVLRNLISTG